MHMSPSGVELQSGLSLGQMLRRSASLRGDELAVADPVRSVGWSQFLDRVARLASAFQTLGLEPGGRVAILANNSVRLLETFFAAAWAGGVATPLNFRLAPAELSSILDDCDPRLFVFDAAHRETALAIATGRTFGGLIFAEEEPPPAGALGFETLIEASEPIPDSGRQGGDLAALYYTSGSTGEPKGVMHTHANLIMSGFTSIPVFRLDEQSLTMICGPLFHVGSMGICFPALMAAASVVVLPRFEPAQVIDTIERHRVTTTSMVPTMLRMVVDHPDARRKDLSSLQTVAFGGAPMPDALMKEIHALAPHARFAHCYGMTETTASCTNLPPRYVTPELRHLGKALSIGRALLGHDIAIVDDEDRQVAPGEIGEIVVRGPLVTPGYWRKPELSAKTLRGGWLHTGDVGHLDEQGFLFIVDRLKDMIITGGENVYSREVEEAVYAFPGVAQCAVIGVPDTRWGERVHAIVVASQGRAIDSEALLAHCRTRIAGYKCPRSVDIRDEPLPLSGANKINKPLLRAAFWAAKDNKLV